MKVQCIIEKQMILHRCVSELFSKGNHQFFMPSLFNFFHLASLFGHLV